MDRAEAVIEAQNRMGKLGLSRVELARRAGVDQGTIGDWLNGRRWPRSETIAAIERALDWPIGAIEGRAALDVSPPEHGGVLLDLPSAAVEGLSEAEREEVIAKVKAAALQAAREIRQARPEQ